MAPNKSTDIRFTYIADGFYDDCDELIHRCSKVDILKFEYFCDIWKDMQLASIFHGRTSGAELAELSEEVLHVAKEYMVGDTENFEESVVGLFLVYALLNLQPYTGFAAVRFVQEDLPAIQRLEMTARRQRRHDVLYVLGSVLVRGPSQYHAVKRERGMESSIRKYLEGYTSMQRAGSRPKGVFYRENEETDILRELNGLARRYTAAKSALNDQRNLNYTNESLMSELESSLKNLISGIYETGHDTETDPEDSESKETPMSIKDRAMRSKVLPMKHLIGVDSNVSLPKSPKKISDIKTTPGRIKSSSPTKATAKKSQKRNATVLRQRVTKKRRRHDSDTDTTDDSADDSWEVTTLQKSPRQTVTEKYPSKNGKDTKISTRNNEKNTQISPRKNVKIVTTSPPKNVQDTKTCAQKPIAVTEPAVDSGTNVSTDITLDQIDLQIDSLPCLISTGEKGQYYEIEIIDELNSKKTVEEPTEETASTSITDSPEVTISKVNNDESTKTTGVGDDMAKVSDLTAKGTLPNKILDKRKLKRPVLKSKLNRIGTLAMTKSED